MSGNIEVTCEAPTESKAGRIDILIESETFSVAIENKIFHHGKNNPWDDYRDHLKRLSAGSRKTKTFSILLALEPKSVKGCPDDWNRVSYQDFFSAVFRKIGPQLPTANPAHLSHLIELHSGVNNIRAEEKMNEQLLDFLNRERNTEVALSFFRQLSGLKDFLRGRVKDIRRQIGQMPPFTSSLWGPLDSNPDSIQDAIYDSIFYKADIQGVVVEVQVSFYGKCWLIGARPKRGNGDDFLTIIKNANLETESTDPGWVTIKSWDEDDDQTVVRECRRILETLAAQIRQEPGVKIR